MTIDELASTFVVTVHRHHPGRPVIVRGKYRCSGCGHRLYINGVAPQSTRTMPVRTWPVELIDRREARRQHGSDQ